MRYSNVISIAVVVKPLIVLVFFIYGRNVLSPKLARIKIPRKK